MDDVSKIIITAGLTLAGGIVVAVVTWLIQSKREHSKWVREQRFILYGEIMGLASSVFIASRASKSAPEMVAKYEEMHTLLGRLNFVGPQRLWILGAQMLTAADSISDTVNTPDHADALQKFSRTSEQFAIAAAKTLRFETPLASLTRERDIGKLGMTTFTLMRTRMKDK